MTLASSFILAAAQLLVPERDTIAVVEAIADRVAVERPLFADDEDRLRTASLVMSIAFREGSLGHHVEGDHSHGTPSSWCTMQINLAPGARTTEGWTGPELRDDPAKCVAVGFRMLRDSIRVDPRNPVSFYARGPRWQGVEARRLSRDRVALAERLLRECSPRASSAVGAFSTAARDLSGSVALRGRSEERP
jgi:hypothetical protein